MTPADLPLPLKWNFPLFLTLPLVEFFSDFFFDLRWVLILVLVLMDLGVNILSIIINK